MLYYHCVRDISRSVIFSTREMNMAVLDLDVFETCFGPAASAFAIMESQKWLQQNSRYAVKLITKGGFITASRSKELSLQRQLQGKFNLSMRKTILRSTIYPVLTQVIFKEISLPEY